jgi:hypothetical protein
LNHYFLSIRVVQNSIVCATAATVTDKFYKRTDAEGGAGAEAEAEAEAAALRRIRDMFECGPRQRHRTPLTSAHESLYLSSSHKSFRAHISFSLLGQLDSSLE